MVCSDCYSYEEADHCMATNGTYYLRDCYNQSFAERLNITYLAEKAIRKPPADEYFMYVLFHKINITYEKCNDKEFFFRNHVLGLSSGIEETGNIRLSMAACLFTAWSIVFLCLCKGVQSSGKVINFFLLFIFVDKKITKTLNIFYSGGIFYCTISVCGISFTFRERCYVTWSKHRHFILSHSRLVPTS